MSQSFIFFLIAYLNPLDSKLPPMTGVLTLSGFVLKVGMIKMDVCRIFVSLTPFFFHGASHLLLNASTLKRLCSFISTAVPGEAYFSCIFQ